MRIGKVSFGRYILTNMSHLILKTQNHDWGSKWRQGSQSPSLKWSPCFRLGTSLLIMDNLSSKFSYK